MAAGHAGVADAASGPVALVTRPEPQAAEWVSKLRAHGCTALALPLLAISPAPDLSPLQTLWAGLGVGDAVMFVSPNAVQHGLAARPPGWAWPAGVWAAATGPGTVAALQAAGVPGDAILCPAPGALQFDSEHLWPVLAQQDWADRRVWVLRGEGGRDWLSERWREAGARVQRLQAYGRQAPAWSAEQQARARQAVAEPGAHVWLLSSSEALGHLPALMPGVGWGASRAIASHPRIAERAQAMGFGQVRTVPPELLAVLEALRAPWAVGPG